MAEMKEIVKLAVDAYKGNVEQYSVAQSQDVLRKALIEANNGKTTLSYKDIRDGKCNGLFTLIEEILSRTVVDGLQANALFNALVDFRNVAEGDKNLFVVEDSTLFVVSEAADGTQGIRRQRIGATTETSIPTSLKVVKIYEELNRVLSGRVDFNKFIDRVAKSFEQKMLGDIYSLWGDATQAGLKGRFGDAAGAFFPTAGTYDEDALLEVIAHTEAAAGGKQAVLIGTKRALRNLTESIQSDSAKEELHKLGYYGLFYSNPVIAIPQTHKSGTTTFAMNDNIISVIAGDDKPIKVVYEGDPIVLMGDPMSKADFTQEYLYGEKYGMGIVVANGNAGIGRYEISTT